jgi:hypothetical protein
MSSLSAPQPVELIWNKGIAALCDRRIPDEFPDGWNYMTNSTLAGALASSKLSDDLIPDPSVFQDLRDGELVWVRLSWLKSFAKQVLPAVKNRFILVTGDSDSCVPSEVMAEAQAILQCPKLIHWYTQNYDGSLATEKISPIPIGIDFHTLSERPIWGEPRSSPSLQEQVLQSVRRALALPVDRIEKIYVDFAWQRSLGLRHYRRYHPLKGTKFHHSRRRIAKMMVGNELTFCQMAPLSRTQMWRERGKYTFVLSPHGMGLDCHRTWEALALGHIVLVPSSSLDVLYAGLPVIALKSWSDITLTNLNGWLSRYSNNIGTNEKLKSSYWVNRMRSCMSFVKASV